MNRTPRGILPVVVASQSRAPVALTCPDCGETFFDADATTCPFDGTALIEQPRTLVDRVIGGRYRIISRLGEGGMGTVYAAEHTLSQRRVALKIIRPELEQSRVARERFLRECKALERVQSAHVVQVLESGESPAGEIYIVMELLEGETLGDRLDRGALPLGEALDVGAQICAALEAAHAKDVVHRDLKADNVFVCADGTVRVLDFGIARLLRGETGADGARPGRITRTGTIVGTPAYISPEGAAGEEVTPAGDLYSLGVMLFEMLTGELPFREASPVLLMGMHLKQAPPSLRDVRSDVLFPDVLVRLVASLLAKTPEQRPASAAAVREALVGLQRAQLAATLTDVPSSVPELAVARPRRGIAVAAVVAGIIAVLGGGIGVAVALLAGENEPAGATQAAAPSQVARPQPSPAAAATRTPPATLPEAAPSPSAEPAPPSDPASSRRAPSSLAGAEPAPSESAEPAPSDPAPPAPAPASGPTEPPTTEGDPPAPAARPQTSRPPVERPRGGREQRLVRDYF